MAASASDSVRAARVSSVARSSPRCSAESSWNAARSISTLCVRTREGLLGPAGLAQRDGDGAEDHAAGLRHAFAEPFDGALAGALGLVEAPEREQRLHLDHDGHGEQVRIRVAAAGEEVDGLLGVGERLLGATGAEPDLRLGCS